MLARSKGVVRRFWHALIDIGDPMRYVHEPFSLARTDGKCSRPWCYCHRGLHRTDKGAYR